MISINDIKEDILSWDNSKTIICTNINKDFKSKYNKFNDIIENYVTELSTDAIIGVAIELLLEKAEEKDVRYYALVALIYDLGLNL